jgi:excisionase family DNA binding protein
MTVASNLDPARGVAYNRRMSDTPNPPPGDWITTAEAAQILGLSQRHISRMVRKGTLTGWQASPKFLLVSLASVRAAARNRPGRGRPRGK